MTVSLIPLTEADQTQCLAWVVPDYSGGKVTNCAWQTHESRQRAAGAMASPLPQGRTAPGQHWFTVKRNETGEKTGPVWFCKNDLPGTACVYDVYLAADFHRQAHQRRAMLALEQAAAARGFNASAFQVFGHNRAAGSLYRSVGYEVTDRNMRDRLAPNN